MNTSTPASTDALMSSRLIEFDDAKQEVLVGIALAKIDELRDEALGLGFQRPVIGANVLS